MHKATPITQKASAFKQTYNSGLVSGARRSAGKFQDLRSEKEKPPIEENKEEINPDLKQEETNGNTNGNNGDNGTNGDNGDNDINSPDGTASGKGGGDGKETKDLMSRKDFMATQGDDVSGGDARQAWRSYQDDPLGISTPLEE